MGAVTALTRFGLGVLDKAHRLLGTERMAAVAKGLRNLSGKRLPHWTPAMPIAADKVTPPTFRPPGVDRVVYFPSCINRSMGPAGGEDLDALPRTTTSLLEKAGYAVSYPDRMDKLCCGMPFASKGLSEAAEAKAAELSDALLSISDNGRIPILCDMSPCLHHMRETLDDRLQLFEPIQFTLTYLAPRLAFDKIEGPIAIHTVCSAKKMGLEDEFRRLAEMCAEKVVTPEVICCGFAGDRGFTVPELNAFGLRRLKKQLPADVSNGYSTSRTCEIGLATHSGIDYRSILYLVDQVTRPKS
jgi:D-lactate dehydrogenase